MKELTSFQQSMRIIMDIVSQIQWANEGLLADKSRFTDERLVKTTCFRTLLLVWEFNEEWKLIEKMSQDDERLRTALKAISPAIRQIRKWGKGLDRIRHQFLAHSRHRDKQGNFVPIKDIFNDPRVPSAFAEMVFLGSLAEMAMNWLCNLYPKDSKACTDWIMNQGEVTESKGFRKLTDAQDELHRINSEIKERVQGTDLHLGNPITGEFH